MTIESIYTALTLPANRAALQGLHLKPAHAGAQPLVDPGNIYKGWADQHFPAGAEFF